MRRRRSRSRPRARRRGFLRKVFDLALAAALLGLLVLVSARFQARETTGVQGEAVVNDGDSLTLGGERIRLIGIDAPELDQTCGEGADAWPCGRLARQALVDAAGGRLVSCSGRERDRYGRLLAACRAGGVELNRTQVAAGWAIAYGAYEAEERAAKASGSGLWAGAFDRPRDWRESHGGMAEGEHGATGLLDWLLRIFRVS